MQQPQILYSKDLSPNAGSNIENKESDELAKFRAAWKAEVQQRRRHEGPGTEAGSSSRGKEPEVVQAQQFEQNPLLHRPAPRAVAGIAQDLTATKPVTIHPAIQNGTLVQATPVSAKMEDALAVYRKAVQHEQKGDLDAALFSYRQAFRMDAHVDRAFHREEVLRAKLQGSVAKVPHGAAADIPQLTSELQQLSVTHSAKDSQHAAVPRLLAHILESFPHDLKFEPEDERKPMHLNNIPIEMWYLIVRKLDVTSVERFAHVCRRTRVITLDPVYWSELVRRTYRPPQLPTPEDLLPVAQKYDHNFRQLFIEHPRVRMDGLYIAICHYIRPGLSENSWVNINHLITYHRYLRFYPNGQVLSLLANEELSPQQAIPIIKPTLRMKGFSIGTWYLTGTTLNIVNLVDASGKYVIPGYDLEALSSNPTSTAGISRPSPPRDDLDKLTNLLGQPGPTTTITTGPSTSSRGHARVHGGHGHSHGHGHGHEHNHSTSEAPAQIRYVFDMTLNVRSKPLGRWNRLDLVTYDSVNLETEEVCPVPLKHERPFWFSKVRSYGH